MEALLKGGVPKDTAGVFYSRVEDSFIAYCYNVNSQFLIGSFPSEWEGMDFIKDNYFYEKSIPV